MKTTLNIPDPLFRRAKLAAADRGITLQDLVIEALTEKLKTNRCVERPWMKAFGALRTLRSESARINRIIEEEFGRLEPEDAT